MSSQVTELHFTIASRPIPKARARWTKSGRGYTPAETQRYEELVGWTANAALAGKLKNEADDLGVRVSFHVSTNQRCDIDNLVKALFDGLNGVVWRDDNQVTELRATLKRGSDRDATDVEVYVTRMRQRDCPTCHKPMTSQQIGRGQIHCSTACYDARQRKGVMRKCEGCGAPVWRNNEKATSERTYCTPECRIRQHGTCRQCQRRLPQSPSARTDFCSRECSLEWLAAQVKTAAAIHTCVTCGASCTREGGRCRRCWLASRPIPADPEERVMCECGAEMKRKSYQGHARRFGHRLAGVIEKELKQLTKGKP